MLGQIAILSDGGLLAFAVIRSRMTWSALPHMIR